MAYEFHYTPTGTGAISGKEVLEQTEDAINDLGNTAISGVQEALDKAEQALTNSENAVDDAQTALNTANNAEGVAIQAQNDVSNLSGTVTNIGNRVTTAEGNIGNLQGRMTTAEGNITNLQGRMTTAEGNIGNLQTAVSTAQATANSAQQTATTARQQSYVFRYSSTTLVASSTNSNTLLDNTDNLKVGDKVIDSSGVLFSITAIDTQNSTFTIGTALIDLAQDSNVVHKSGDETIGGEKTFTNNLSVYNASSANTPIIGGKSSVSVRDSTNTNGDNLQLGFYDKNNNSISYIRQRKLSNGNTDISLNISNTDSNNQPIEATLNFVLDSSNDPRLSPGIDNTISLGRPTFRYKSFYGMNYYYGSNNVEFSTKFVTTDTAQTVSGAKTFSSDVNIYNSDNTATTPYLFLKNSKTTKGSTSEIGAQILRFVDKNNNILCDVESIITSTGSCELRLRSNTLDSNNQNVQTGVTLISSINGSRRFCPTNDNKVSCGYSALKWSDVQTYKVNNLEPSSLSLPSDKSARIDISSYFTNTGTGDKNTYTVPANGYIYMDVNDCVSLYMFSQTTGNLSNYGNSICRNAVGRVIGFLPVRKDDVFTSQWYTSATNVTLASAFFIPCQGNV